jgi:dimethylamine/trimethylamine dehydrogenase
VTLAEARGEAGGRVTLESRLPGLADWARVRDYRMQQIQRMAKVQLFLDSRLDAAQIREFAFARVILATGAAWRRDGVGRSRRAPLPGLEQANVLSPDDLMAGKDASGPVVIYDDDHYYMGGVLAEKLACAGQSVTLVTPAPEVSAWTKYTLEQPFIERRLHEQGVTVVERHSLVAAGSGDVEIEHEVSGRRRTLPCATLVLVTMRLPHDGLYHDLMADPQALAAGGIRSLTRIGDCLAPSTIAAAVYSGHRQAREMDEEPSVAVPFKREMIALET